MALIVDNKIIQNDSGGDFLLPTKRLSTQPAAFLKERKNVYN
jgi:hypothetical protein